MLRMQPFEVHLPTTVAEAARAVDNADVVSTLKPIMLQTIIGDNKIGSVCNEHFCGTTSICIYDHRTAG